MNTRHQPAAPAPLPHTLLEDAAAIFTGVLMISVGVALFKQAGLVTGGMAGLAFSLHYATHIGFGVWFFVLNLPFYWLAVRKMGWAFTVKTFCAVGLLAVVSELQPLFLSLERVQAPYAAVVGGILMGDISKAAYLMQAFDRDSRATQTMLWVMSIESLVGLGLTLFLVTLMLNIIAHRIVQTYREQYD